MRILDLPSRPPRREAMKSKEFVRVQTKKPKWIALRLRRDDDRRKEDGCYRRRGRRNEYNIIMIFVDGLTDRQTDSP